MSPVDKELLKIFQMRIPRATTSDVKKWSESQHLWAAENYSSAARWINRTIKFLDSNLNEIDYEKFIINIHGLIADLPDFIGKKIGVFKLLGFGSISEYRDYIIKEMRNRGMQMHLLMLIELHSILAAFVDKFTVQEIFAVTYFRNTYCHPALSAYTVKISSKKKKVQFNPATYEAFRKLQPYAEVDLCKTMFDKLTVNKNELEKIKRMLLALRS